MKGDLRNPAVEHSTELCSDDERFNTIYFTSFQHVSIGYLILPSDRGYLTQSAHAKLIETAYT